MFALPISVVWPMAFREAPASTRSEIDLQYQRSSYTRFSRVFADGGYRRRPKIPQRLRSSRPAGRSYDCCRPIARDSSGSWLKCSLTVSLSPPGPKNSDRCPIIENHAAIGQKDGTQIMSPRITFSVLIVLPTTVEVPPMIALLTGFPTAK